MLLVQRKCEYWLVWRAGTPHIWYMLGWGRLASLPHPALLFLSAHYKRSAANLYIVKSTVLRRKSVPRRLVIGMKPIDKPRTFRTTLCRIFEAPSHRAAESKGFSETGRRGEERHVGCSTSCIRSTSRRTASGSTPKSINMPIAGSSPSRSNSSRR
jgi:hypothetical protein